MKQKQRRQKDKEREKTRNQKKAKNKDKKEERKERERERERERQRKRNWKRGMPKKAKEKQGETLQNKQKMPFSSRKNMFLLKAKKGKKNKTEQIFVWSF